jgi:hypothetical protein
MEASDISLVQQALLLAHFRDDEPRNEAKSRLGSEV